MTTTSTTAPMPTSAYAADDRPDTRDMVVVHRVFRRELHLLPDMVRRTAPNDAAQAALVADWAVALIDLLHHHHHNEDELVWPRLHERASLERELVITMQRQHDEIARLLAPVTPLAANWKNAPTAPNRDVLARALDPIAAPLNDHLDLEEREVLALIEAHLTSAEYGELAVRGRAAIEPAMMPTVLGAFLEEATAEETEMMTAGMPVPARAAWTLVGRRQYARSMRRLRGTR